MIILFFIGFAIPSEAQLIRYETGDTLYVFASNGLNMREEPNTMSRKMQTLEFGESVIVLNDEEKYYEIDNRLGTWVQVEANGKIGFLYSGFLSDFRPPIIHEFDCTSKPLLDWLTERNKDNEIIEINERDFIGHDSSGKDSYSIEWKYYTNGDIHYVETYYEDIVNRFESFDLHFNDLLNFIEHLRSLEYKHCQFDPNVPLSKLRPMKRANGELVRIECTYPFNITVNKNGTKTIIELL